MRLTIVSLGFVALLLSSCTEPGETTQVGAATGGVLGAGLGAIVGNQTGDPGSGFVVGALAGASAGAVVANSLEAQEEAIASQDLALERQERRIQAQQADLNDLRLQSQDNPSSFGQPMARAPSSIDSRAQFNGRNRGESASMRNSLRETTIISNSGMNTNPPVEPRFSGSGATAPSRDLGGMAGSHSSLRSTECTQAQSELVKAQAALESADKLFHVRRALRLCPEEPLFHHSLGKLYQTLGRSADAEFEFQEARRLDPNFNPAS